METKSAPKRARHEPPGFTRRSGALSDEAASITHSSEFYVSRHQNDNLIDH
jgi:hypothetical protein